MTAEEYLNDINELNAKLKRIHSSLLVIKDVSQYIINDAVSLTRSMNFIHSIAVEALEDKV